MTASTVEMQESAEGLYTKLATVRDQYLDRAKRAASVTLPHLFTNYEGTEGEDIPQPWTSFGSRAVNSLVNKLLLALFPVNTPFFKLVPNEELRGALEAEPDETQLAEEFATITKEVLEDMAASATRVKMEDALRHIVVAGNAVVRHREGRERVFHLPSYVVKRTPEGMVNMLIIREQRLRATLSAEQKAMLRDAPSSSVVPEDRIRPGPGEDPSEAVDLWTVVRWDADKNHYTEHQELGRVRVGTPNTYAKDKLPYLVLRMIAVDGEDYGRSYVEMYEGDLRSLNGLSRAVTEGAAQLSRILWGVDPGSGTDSRVLNNAQNGDFVPVREGSVFAIQADKLPDMQFTRSWAQEIEQRLGAAFLLNSSVQRDAERVTAEEIRLLASELNASLGGVYGLLTIELQMPMVKMLIDDKDLNNELVKRTRIAITAGLDAIGRGFEFESYRQWGLHLNEMGFPVPGIVSGRRYAEVTGNLLGVEHDKVVLTAEEIQQQQQQAVTQDVITKATPQILKAIEPQLQEMMAAAQQNQ